MPLKFIWKEWVYNLSTYGCTITFLDISQLLFSIGGSTFQAILSDSAVNMIMYKSFESDFLDLIYSSRITGSENTNIFKALWEIRQVAV